MDSPDHIANVNPFRYRGYYYDAETGFYWLQSRYYDPEVGRFLNSDGQIFTGNDMTGMNLFAYCGDDSVNRLDPTGKAWWHWALGAGVVAGCAALTVVTGGGFAVGAAAIGMAASGASIGGLTGAFAAATIGSGVALGTMAAVAVAKSNTVKDFNSQGNWGTVAATVGGAILDGVGVYAMSKAQTPTTTGRGMQNPKVKAAVQKGQAMHKQMNYGTGVVKEKTIAPGCRVDGIDFNNRIIYELKPNNQQAIARGISQLNRYTEAASQQYGGTWTGVLKIYD